MEPVTEYQILFNITSGREDFYTENEAEYEDMMDDLTKEGALEDISQCVKKTYIWDDEIEQYVEDDVEILYDNILEETRQRKTESKDRFNKAELQAVKQSIDTALDDLQLTSSGTTGDYEDKSLRDELRNTSNFVGRYIGRMTENKMLEDGLDLSKIYSIQNYADVMTDKVIADMKYNERNKITIDDIINVIDDNINDTDIFSILCAEERDIYDKYFNEETIDELKDLWDNQSYAESQFIDMVKDRVQKNGYTVYDEYNESKKVTESKKLTEGKYEDTLEAKVSVKVLDYFTNTLGFDEDEAVDYYDTSVKSDKDTIEVEVDADLSYDDFNVLIPRLNRIIQTYDKEAYFDMVESGIAKAVIDKNAYNRDKKKIISADKERYAKEVEEESKKTESKYIVCAYYDTKCHDFEDELETDDWSEATLFAHDKLMHGFMVEIENIQTGKYKRINPDEYMEEFDGEFTVRPDELEESKKKTESKYRTRFAQKEYDGFYTYPEWDAGTEESAYNISKSRSVDEYPAVVIIDGTMYDKDKNVIHSYIQKCPMCKNEYAIDNVDVNLIKDYLHSADKKVQDVFPELNQVEREFIKSGYCPKCQKDIFGTDITSNKIHRISALGNIITESKALKTEAVEVCGGDKTNYLMFYTSNYGTYKDNTADNIAQYGKEHLEGLKDLSLEEIKDKHLYWGTETGFNAFYNGDTYVLFDDIEKLPEDMKKDAYENCKGYDKKTEGYSLGDDKESFDVYKHTAEFLNKVGKELEELGWKYNKQTYKFEKEDITIDMEAIQDNVNDLYIGSNKLKLSNLARDYSSYEDIGEDTGIIYYVSTKSDDYEARQLANRIDRCEVITQTESKKTENITEVPDDLYRTKKSNLLINPKEKGNGDLWKVRFGLFSHEVYNTAPTYYVYANDESEAIGKTVAFIQKHSDGPIDKDDLVRSISDMEWYIRKNFQDEYYEYAGIDKNAEDWSDDVPTELEFALEKGFIPVLDDPDLEYDCYINGNGMIVERVKDKKTETIDEVEDYGPYYVKEFNESGTDMDTIGFETEQEATDYAREQLKKRPNYEYAVYETETDECLYVYNSKDESKKKTESALVDLDPERYEEIKSKQVLDSDGFYNDYTMYYDKVNNSYVFVFGDIDLYEGTIDHEEENKEVAEEWFDDFDGFDDLEETKKVINEGSSSVTPANALLDLFNELYDGMGDMYAESEWAELLADDYAMDSETMEDSEIIITALNKMDKNAFRDEVDNFILGLYENDGIDYLKDTLHIYPRNLKYIIKCLNTIKPYASEPDKIDTAIEELKGVNMDLRTTAEEFQRYLHDNYKPWTVLGTTTGPRTYVNLFEVPTEYDIVGADEFNYATMPRDMLDHIGYGWKQEGDKIVADLIGFGHSVRGSSVVYDQAPVKYGYSATIDSSNKEEKFKEMANTLMATAKEIKEKYKLGESKKTEAIDTEEKAKEVKEKVEQDIQNKGTENLVDTTEELYDKLKKEIYAYAKQQGLDLEKLRKQGIELETIADTIDNVVGDMVSKTVIEYMDTTGKNIMWDFNISNNDIQVIIQ